MKATEDLGTYNDVMNRSRDLNLFKLYGMGLKTLPMVFLIIGVR